MFSTGEFDYIKGLTLNYYDNGYLHYLCITNNPINLSSNNNVYDVYCYYSKEKMEVSNGNLSLPSDTVECSFDSNNYSSNNNIDKLVCESTSGTVSLSSKEFVYSDSFGYSDIISDYKQVYQFKDNFHLIGLSILSILIIIFLHTFICKILRR